MFAFVDETDRKREVEKSKEAPAGQNGENEAAGDTRQHQQELLDKQERVQPVDYNSDEEFICFEKSVKRVVMFLRIKFFKIIWKH